MAGAKVTEVAGEASSVAADISNEVVTTAKKGGHRLQDTAEKARHVVEEVAVNVVHAAEEAALEVVDRKEKRSAGPATADRSWRNRPVPSRAREREGETMLNLLWVAAVVLVVMWMLGFALHVTVGGFIHVLLALAVISDPPSRHRGPPDCLKWRARRDSADRGRRNCRSNA